jgi:hypothetical protein
VRGVEGSSGRLRDVGAWSTYNLSLLDRVQFAVVSERSHDEH